MSHRNIQLWQMRAHSLQYIFLFLLVHNSEFLENLIKSYSALIWQKEASDKSDISRKRAKCVCHLHWRQWNIRMSYFTYLLVGWVFLHEIWRRRRAHYVNYENINNSNLDGMSLASFCQSRAVLYQTTFWCGLVLNGLTLSTAKYEYLPEVYIIYIYICMGFNLMSPSKKIWSRFSF